MSCYHPLKGFVLPAPWKDVGYEIKVQGYDVDCMIKHDNGNWYPGSKHTAIKLPEDRYTIEFIDIPCGKCYGCRLDYSKEWADRCLMELQSHKSAYFLTLTYKDGCLPYKNYVDFFGRDVEGIPDGPRCLLNPAPLVNVVTGELACNATLYKRDVQLFMKRLRETTGQKIRYYLAGEYGDQSCRPHYHAIMFGLEIPDLQIYKRKNGYILYRSKLLDSIWKNGNVIIGECNWQTCAYTARYVMKKANGNLKEVYNARGIDPEFVLCSRRPGIGRAYFDKHGKELYKFRTTPLSDQSGSRLVRSTNRYFDRCQHALDPDFMNEQKKKRIDAAKHTELLKDAQTSMNKLDRLLAEEECLIVKNQSYLRVDN